MTQMHTHAFRFSANPASCFARLRRLAGPAHHGLLLAAVMLMTAGTVRISAMVINRFGERDQSGRWCCAVNGL